MKKITKIISVFMVITLLLCGNVVTVSAGTWGAIGYDVKGWKWYLETETDGTKPDAAVYLDNSVKHSGDYSLKMVYRSSPLKERQLRGEIACYNIKPGSTYRLGFYAKAEKALNVSMAMEYIGDWMALTKTYGSTFDWKPFEFEFKQTLDKNTTRFVIASYDLCEGFWIDDVYLYEYVDGEYVGENLFPNQGFEGGGTAEIIASSKEESNSGEEFNDITTDSAIIVREKEGIVIDGDLSDWEEYDKYDINTYVQLVDNTSETVDANISYAYDEENLYFAVDVTDEEHNYVGGSDYWRGDGIQFVLDNNNANGYGEAIGAYYDTKNNELVFVSDNGSVTLENAEDTIYGKCNRIEHTTTYEVKVPWDFLGLTCPDKIKFDLIVNDNDNGVRKGYIEIAPGIGKYKSNEKYPYLFMGEGKGFSNVYVAKDQLQVNEPVYCNIEYTNPTNEEKTISIESKSLNETIIIPPMKKYIGVKYFTNAFDIGNICDKIIIDDGGEQQEYTINYSIIPDEKFSYDFADTVKVWHDELVILRDECKKYGIATDYEDIDIQVLEIYVENIKNEAEHKMFYRVANYYEVLTRIYNECKAKLEAYLNGQEDPISVPRYITGDVELRNGVFYGSVVEDGIVKEKPIIFYGYNSFESPKKIAEYLKNLGHNHMQVELYAKRLYQYSGGEFIHRDEENRYETYSDYAETIALLEEAEKNNIAVDFLLHTMGFYSNEVAVDYPDFKEAGASYAGYMPFTPTHEMLRKQATVAYSEMAEFVNRFDCIKSICLVNEPSLHLYDKKYYQPGWVEYLKKSYDNSIDKFNIINKTSYLSFEDVVMPSEITLTPLYHDYRMYCEEICAEFISILAGEVKKNLDLPVSVKIVQQTRVYQADNFTKKLNTVYEKFYDYVDLAGCDAFYNYSDKNLTLQAKMEWYDYLTSVKNTPIPNTEEHWFVDYTSSGKNDYSEFMVNSIEASGWQGMIHGGVIQDIWIFSGNDRSHGYSGMSANEQEGYYATDVMMIPESMRLAGKLALDASRLSEEIYAIQAAPREVGILWSNTTWSYNTKFLNGLYKAYTASIYNGQKVRFVTESTLEQMKDCKIMIIPGSTNVPHDVIEALKAYVDNGGRLILIGEDAVKFDDHNQPFDDSELAYIKDRAMIIPCELFGGTSICETPENLDEILEEEFVKAGIMNVVIKDTATGETVENVEWIASEHDGKTIISIFNYDYVYEPEIEIFVNGKKVKKINEIKACTAYDGSMKVESYKPYMISVEGTGFSDISNVQWAEEAINTLYNNKIIDGVGSNKFAPNDYVTREQIAKIIVSCTENELMNKSKFDDVDQDAWYAKYVATAEKIGITNGVSEEIFGVGQHVTRQDLARMVYMAAIQKGIVDENETKQSSFIDSGDISNYAKNAVGVLQAKGILNGNAEFKFMPKNYCTRAEAAKIIYDIFFKGEN